MHYQGTILLHYPAILSPSQILNFHLHFMFPIYSCPSQLLNFLFSGIFPLQLFTLVSEPFHAFSAPEFPLRMSVCSLALLFALPSPVSRLPYLSSVSQFSFLSPFSDFFLLF